MDFPLSLSPFSFSPFLFFALFSSSLSFSKSLSSWSEAQTNVLRSLQPSGICLEAFLLNYSSVGPAINTLGFSSPLKYLSRLIILFLKLFAYCAIPAITSGCIKGVRKLTHGIWTFFIGRPKKKI